MLGMKRTGALWVISLLATGACERGLVDGPPQDASPAPPRDALADTRASAVLPVSDAANTATVDSAPARMADAAMNGRADAARGADGLAPPPSDASEADPEPGRLAGITRQHNAERATIPVPPLTWDPALAAAAQAYAERCIYQHSMAPNLGENLAADAPPDSNAAAAVALWVGEKADYNYAANTCTPNVQCGHYTQVVWRSSTRLGCGVAICETGSPFGARFPRWEIWVCNYSPPGNFNGQRPY
jgi:pathogenesis-related protein 1